MARGNGSRPLDPPKELTYTTPLATLTGPRSMAPFGSAVCQRTFPVSGSAAPQLPALERMARRRFSRAVVGVPFGGLTIG
jgi:hypothetical protein